jgi:hypothetical protein
LGEKRRKWKVEG